MPATTDDFHIPHSTTYFFKPNQIAFGLCCDLNEDLLTAESSQQVIKNLLAYVAKQSKDVVNDGTLEFFDVDSIHLEFEKRIIIHEPIEAHVSYMVVTFDADKNGAKSEIRSESGSNYKIETEDKLESGFGADIQHALIRLWEQSGETLLIEKLQQEVRLMTGQQTKVMVQWLFPQFIHPSEINIKGNKMIDHQLFVGKRPVAENKQNINGHAEKQLKRAGTRKKSVLTDIESKLHAKDKSSASDFLTRTNSITIVCIIMGTIGAILMSVFLFIPYN